MSFQHAKVKVPSQIFFFLLFLYFFPFFNFPIPFPFLCYFYFFHFLLLLPSILSYISSFSHILFNLIFLLLYPLLQFFLLSSSSTSFLHFLPFSSILLLCIVYFLKHYLYTATIFSVLSVKIILIYHVILTELEQLYNCLGSVFLSEFRNLILCELKHTHTFFTLCQVGPEVYLSGVPKQTFSIFHGCYMDLALPP